MNKHLLSIFVVFFCFNNSYAQANLESNITTTENSIDIVLDDYRNSEDSFTKPYLVLETEKLNFDFLSKTYINAGDLLLEISKYPDTLNKNKVIKVVATELSLWVGSMAYLQYIWYSDHNRVPFHFYDDSKGYLQTDKFGHIYGSYIESYIGYHALRSAGVKKNKALLYGGTLGILLQTPIEIWDGMYEGWGFSWSDMAANSLGSAIVIGQELLFDEQIAKYKFSFSQSPYAKQANGYLGNGFNEIFNDYNGHTYWLSFGLNKIIPSKKIPDWLNIALGYSANGMFGEFKNIHRYKGVNIPETQRYRQFMLSLDVDWTKIKTNNKFLKSLFKSMFMVKMIFPALEINSLGNIKGHWIYY